MLTSVGEWGDRSQIATIAMAAGSDWAYVILGALAGHAICTGIAVYVDHLNFAVTNRQQDWRQSYRRQSQFANRCVFWISRLVSADSS